MHKSSRFRTVRRPMLMMSAAALAATMAPAALGFPAAQAEPAEPGSVDQIQWKKCPDEFFAEGPRISEADKPRFSCATYAVPISHDDPTKGSLNIALSRKAAGKPSAKIGSVFLNPGGPGGSGWTFSAASGLTKVVSTALALPGAPHIAQSRRSNTESRSPAREGVTRVRI